MTKPIKDAAHLVRYAFFSAVLAISLLGKLLPLSISSATAQNSSEYISVILSKLPPVDGASYLALRAAAGEADAQTLGMTNSEVWSLPASNIEALTSAASRIGVDFEVLDADWNTMLKPMAENAPMTSEQKDMMKRSMESNATMGMSMMDLSDTKTIEYALTQGIGTSEENSMRAEISIPITDKLTVRAVRQHVEMKRDGCIWIGFVDETDEPVSLMFWPSGRLTGRITYKGETYMIRHLGGSMHGVIELSPKAMPPEHAPMDSDTMKKMNMKEDPLSTKGDAGKLHDQMNKDRLDRSNTEHLEDARVEHAQAARLVRVPVAAPPGRDASKHAKGAAASETIEIDVVVAYTKAAAARYSDIRLDLIEFAVEDTNQTFRVSGAGNVRLNVVHTYETSYTEKGSHFEHVFAFADKGDEKMEEIHALRDQHRADIALLIVHDPNGCGLSAAIAPAADRAFAVVHHACAATSYSLAHEIGHIIGARHDIARDDDDQPFPFGHGFVHGTSWRTMMSYEESCGGCPRLPVWSNPEVSVRGTPAGDARANNARVLREGAKRVAAFR